ncbi:MAG: hypothetical protein JRJ57_10270 [Deltaproteobacteria bacterium]|nr:hypothetical protein [Deltaproteobacteria bacterium]
MGEKLSIDSTLKCDVLVIGAGGAGLRALIQKTQKTDRYFTCLIHGRAQIVLPTRM